MPEPALQADESLMELPEGQETKRCAACRIVKPVSEYYKDRTHSRGIKTRCKQCLRLCKEAFKNQQRAKSAAEQVTVLLTTLPASSQTAAFKILRQKGFMQDISWNRFLPWPRNAVLEKRSAVRH